MDYGFFQFNMEFYKVLKDNKNINIDNPVSPLISEVLMTALEMKLKKYEQLQLDSLSELCR